MMNNEIIKVKCIKCGMKKYSVFGDDYWSMLDFISEMSKCCDVHHYHYVKLRKIIIDENSKIFINIVVDGDEIATVEYITLQDLQKIFSILGYKFTVSEK